jgi:hypothetical protein
MDGLDPFSANINMISYADPADFDYVNFLHEGSMHPYGNMRMDGTFRASSSAATLSDSSSKMTPVSPGAGFGAGSSSGATDIAPLERPSEEQQRQQQKQRLERKGHTKSRRGCYNCKRRRIKCQESRPSCGHCVKTGLKCEYPSLPQIIHQPHDQIPLFSLQDMRFFQHFLTQCYPHHPLKQEEIWTHEIPCIAHNHDFLMHAILGYSASELIRTDPSLVTVAMNHRVKAIRSIKARLSDAHRTTSYEEANALVATCFALTFQSVSLDDGLAEYMTFIRGIVILAIQMAFKGIQPVFSNLMDQDQNKILEPLMEGLPLIQRGWADAASEAVASLRPLCVEGVELEYLTRMETICQQLYINSWDAYRAHTQFYGWFMMLPHATFQHLIDPNNQTIMLLHSHYIALSQMMVFITEQEYLAREKHASRPTTMDNSGPSPGFLRWLKYLNSRIDYEHQIYNHFPTWVQERLDSDVSFFGKRW